MSKVWVVGGDYLIEEMFLKRGWGVVNNPDEADLIQFTGGEDVSPHMYGQAKHASTYSNAERDALEADIFHYIGNDKPKAGICRGGQFLNVMSGGSMNQDVEGHLGDHVAYVDTGIQAALIVTSTHHQMMIPSGEAKEIMVAFERDISQRDIECLYYPDTNSLCYQPHPEYMKIGDDCQEMYFYLIKEFLKITEEDV